MYRVMYQKSNLNYGPIIGGQATLSKQFYKSFSNINYGSVVGGGHMLEGKNVCFQGNMWSERKVLIDMNLSLRDVGKRKGLCIK